LFEEVKAMQTSTIEQRLARVEQEVAQLKANAASSGKYDVPWLDRIAGAFENNAVFKEAMRLGEEYRRSLKPKPKKSRKA
jgi:hypothetical protein